jgi:hypothetical protein
MMASQPDSGPNTQDRENPGDETLNPAGTSTDAPAEGDEDADPRQPGSPQG